VERGQVAEDGELDVVRALGEGRRHEIGRRHEPVRLGVVLVDPDGVESVLLVERHLVQVLGVHLLAAGGIEAGVGVRVVRRGVEMGPGHQVEGIDLHHSSFSRG